MDEEFINELNTQLENLELSIKNLEDLFEPYTNFNQDILDSLDKKLTCNPFNSACVETPVLPPLEEL